MLHQNTLLEKYKNRLLTAIVVTYKQGEFIYDTLDSILMQDYPSIELIIADDGTPEFNTEAVRAYIDCHKYANIEKVIILHGSSNIGTVRNINKALSHSNGEYIKLIGGDDTYTYSRVFSDQISTLQKNPEAFAVVGKVQQCDAKMNPIFDERVEKSNRAIPLVLRMEYDESRRHIHKNGLFPIVIQATCFKRDFFLQWGLCDESYRVLDDSPVILKLLRSNKNVLYIDKLCVNHRSDVGISMSKEMFSPNRLAYYEDCVTYAEQEIRNNPHVYGYVGSIEIPRVNKLVRDMALSKRRSKSSFTRVIIFFKYFDAILYYSTTNTRKLIRRVFKSFKATEWEAFF